MINDKLLMALNEQINAELTSAYSYLAMASYFQDMNLEGSARWMQRQAREEVGHAMKIYDFIHDREGRVTLLAVAQPQGRFDSPLAVWETALQQEQKITGRIHALYKLANDENDYSAQVMLQWFVTEQVEEEKTVRGVLEQLRKIGAASSAIYFLDRHLGKEAEKEPE
jgi:ferritin